jgi:hypothetical protein
VIFILGLASRCVPFGLHRVQDSSGFFFYGGLTLPYNRIRACVIGVGYREPHPELSFCFSMPCDAQSYTAVNPT